MTRIWTVALAFIVAGSLTACSSSKPDRRGPPPNMQNGLMLKPAGLLFAGFDSDQNYSVSSAELSSGLTLAFRRADADGSGQLSLIEYQDWAAKALGSPTATPGWIELDRDDTKSIDPVEFRGGFKRLAQSYGLSAPNGLRVAELTSDISEIRSAARSSGARSASPRSGGRPPRIQTDEEYDQR